MMDKIRNLCESVVNYGWGSENSPGPGELRLAQEILSLLDAKPVSSGLSERLRTVASAELFDHCPAVRDRMHEAADALDLAEAEKAELEAMIGVNYVTDWNEGSGESPSMVYSFEGRTYRPGDEHYDLAARIAKRGGVNS